MERLQIIQKTLPTSLFVTLLSIAWSTTSLATPVVTTMHFTPAGWSGEFVFDDATGVATGTPGIIAFDVISYEVIFDVYSWSEQDSQFSQTTAYADAMGRMSLDFGVIDDVTGFAILGESAVSATSALDSTWIGIPDCGGAGCMYEYTATMPVRSAESTIPEPRAAALFGTGILILFSKLRGYKRT
jgi:hypothetical protein